MILPLKNGLKPLKSAISQKQNLAKLRSDITLNNSSVVKLVEYIERVK